MRLEVVDGKTPFLLSNAFLRALGADVCSSAQEHVVPKLGVRIPLQCDSKGLYQVELADVLTRLVPHRDVVNCEVVTMIRHDGGVNDEVGSGIDVGVIENDDSVAQKATSQSGSLQAGAAATLDSHVGAKGIAAGERQKEQHSSAVSNGRTTTGGGTKL